MEFYIGKNATLPLLKMQIVKDGRIDQYRINDFIEKSSIYFSMVDINSGNVKINLAKAGFVNKIFDDPNTPPEYYIYYKFSKKDTKKIGRYEGQFVLKNEEGTLILPIRENLFINIQESNIPENEVSIVISQSIDSSIIPPNTDSLPFQLGRKEFLDVRDNNYLISNFFEKILTAKSKVVVRPTRTPTPTRTRPRPTITPSPTPSISKTNTNPTPTPTASLNITSKYWQDDAWWGNQGNTPMCVGYAWSHWISDGPVFHSGNQPIIQPSTIYYEAQKIDEWPGENYDGTSVRAGVKYLQQTGKVVSYYWAFDVNTLIKTILEIGPVVVGTNWYYGMFYPNVNGLIRVSGSLAGGHAYVINGVDTVNRLFRIKNSWGQSWGVRGHAYISFTDMARLINERGEICLAIEMNF